MKTLAAVLLVSLFSIHAHADDDLKGRFKLLPPGVDPILSPYAFSGDIGVDFGSKGMNNAQVRGNQVYAWVRNLKTDKNSTLAKFSGDANGEISSVMIEDWENRKDNLERKLKIERTDRPGVCIETGPFLADYNDKIPLDAPQTLAKCDFFEKMKPVYIAAKAEFRARTARFKDAGELKDLDKIYLELNNKIYAENATVNAEYGILEACKKTNPRDKYLALPSFGVERKIAIATLKERYDVNPLLEASEYMKAVCERLEK